jgi:deoxyribonuclease-1
MLPDVKLALGSCLVKIDNRKVEPTIESRSQIARTYLYMEQRYPRFTIDLPPVFNSLSA